MGHDYKTKEYRSWRAMKTRCLWKKGSKWPRYGGRGIKIYPPWLRSFDRFLEDVGHAPSPRHSLGRIDNNGDYGPSNCRWETPSQQARNKKPSKLLPDQIREIKWLLSNGETVTRLARAYRISHSLVSMIKSGRRHAYAT